MRANDSKSTKAVLERMRDNLSISIMPSGKEIPPKVLEALQQSFVQARDSGPLGEASVILDLSLVAEILELLDQVSGTDSV
jgi:signal transduction histidine kinase